MKAFAVVDSKGRTYTITTPRGDMLVMSSDYKQAARYIAGATEDDLRIVEVEIKRL